MGSLSCKDRHSNHCTRGERQPLPCSSGENAMSLYAKEINRILASLNGPEVEENPPLPEEEDLDTIHVYPVEGGGILLTRTPLEDEEAAPVIDSQPDQPTTRAVPRTPPP